MLRSNHFLPVESCNETALIILRLHFSPHFPLSPFAYPPFPNSDRGCLGWLAAASSMTKTMITWASTGRYSTSLAISVGAADCIRGDSLEALTIPDQIQAIAELRSLVGDLHEAGLRLQVRHGHDTSLLVFIHVPRDHLGQMVHKSRSACLPFEVASHLLKL